MKTKPHINLLTDIIGTKIITPRGENIGVVQNMLVDQDSNVLIYIVLCYANFIGKTHRYFAIPSKVLKSESKYKNTLVLSISRKELLGAPGFSPQKCLVSPWQENDHRIYELYKKEKTMVRSARENT